MTAAASPQDGLRTLRRVSLLAGFLGGIGSALAYFVAPAAFFPTYLVAFLFWLGMSLGALAISMLHHVTGGRWGYPVRRIVESGAGTVALLAVFFLPLIPGMARLYVWSQPDAMAADEILQRKSHYLNVDDFLIRAAIYFVIWIGSAWLLNSLTRTSDADKQFRRQRRLAILSSLGLLAWGLSVTFASVDWAMSIEPHWFSSMFGVLFMAGQAVSALAGTIVVVILLHRRSPSINPLTSSVLHDLGNLLLAFVMFWSYVSFMQFLIIWGGNLPEETPWYLRRTAGGWQSLVFLLMVLHFLLPVLLLLVRQNKRREMRLIRLASLLIGMRLVDLAWLVLPTFATQLTGLGAEEVTHGAHVPETTLHWYHLWPLLVTVPGIGGFWLALFSWNLGRRVDIPVYEFVASQDETHAVPTHATTG